ncbi:sialin-like [Drosophila bipectinata]|uniref:sialin-like n=1 Tax=Drosophila bipectinata TaxID=42026 RepID=UPI001C898D6F|nr:sialin-like [Drosophila bipectinata]
MSSKSWTLPRLSESGPSAYTLLNSVRFTYALCAFTSSCLHSNMRGILGIILLQMVMPRSEDRVENVFEVESNATKIARCNGSSPQQDVSSLLKISMLGDLKLSRKQELIFLGIYYYGYVVSVFFSGRLADRYSRKNIFLLSHILEASSNVQAFRHLGPSNGENSSGIFCMLRGASGLHSGISYVGFLSDLSWELPFYLLGAISLLFGFCSFWLIYDTPEQHPRISQHELKYLQQGYLISSQKVAAVPWRILFRSRPVYAFLFTHLFHCYTFLNLSTLLPHFLLEAMQLNRRQVILTVTVAFLGALASKLVCILGASYVERRVGPNQDWIRRVLYVMCSTLSISFLFVIIMADCGDTILVIAMFVLLRASTDLGFNCYWPTLLYMAPSFVGMISGFANALAHLSGFLAPLLVASLVETGSKTEWNVGLMTLIFVNALALLVFGLFSSTILQTWDPCSLMNPSCSVETK